VGFKLLKIVVFGRADEVRIHFNLTMFGGCISRGSTITWLPRSLGLSPPKIFFLWGHVNNLINQVSNNDLPHNNRLFPDITFTFA
jgi:hypothetical protein